MKQYYKPKKIECLGNRPIYEFIGIRLYKKYLPFTGDIARRWRHITQVKLHSAERINELYKYEKQTRKYEVRHLAGAILFIVLVFVSGKELTLFDRVFLTLLNLYVNIYPVFLQRYNRIRIIQVLLNNGYKSPYDE